MSRDKIQFFYLPLNRQVIWGLIGVIMLVSFGLIKFDSAGSVVEQPVFRQQVEPYYQGPTDQQVASLTINVAWGQEYIPELLDILDEYDVKATFFFVGTWVEKYPELTQEIKQRGHELGNHGFEHLHPKQLSKEELKDLILDNQKLIQQIADYKTDLFAPPYGEVDDRVAKIASEIGYKTIMWSVDTIDWQRPQPEVIIQRVTDKIKPGGIILLHPTQPTVKALPQIITRLREQGYQLETVSQLLE
ncbi:polysaccharide deacetylase family protein [Halanaerobaculum tunisiense]